MTPHDELGPETDRALDELLDAASDEAESGSFPRPSFAAVLQRARRLDPSLAAPPSSPRPRQSRADDDARALGELAPFVEAARAEAELDARVAAGRVPPGLPRDRSGVTRWVIVGGALAAAAAIVLLLGLLEARSALQADGRREGDQVMDQADRDRPLHEAETGGDEVPSLATAPRTRSRGAAIERNPSPDHVIPEEAIPLEELVAPLPPPPELETIVSPTEPAVAEPAAATPRERRDRAREALRRLDDQAQQRLAAGDTAGAEKAYRAIVRRGGKSGLAELAYGDLFTLAHGRGDGKELRSLWREYLVAFPRGRFADDARAGLCRGASSSERRACWERYLDDFPTGAYHRQAVQALSRGGSSAGEPAP